MTVDTIPQRKHSLILHYCNTVRQLSTVVRYLFVIKKFDWKLMVLGEARFRYRPQDDANYGEVKAIRMWFISHTNSVSY